ncbi:MAG: SDR family oxidoreductase, partial [Marivita lacus]|nr:SDR family oxidoreductase [Marivita lacus]
LDAFIKAEAIDPVRAYDLSKEAVIVWGLSNVARFRDLGLRINAVSPAAVATPILDDFMTAFGERASRGVDLTGRAGQPDEIAQVIRFLASPEASWVTGCNIECDGGLTAQIEYAVLTGGV